MQASGAKVAQKTWKVLLVEDNPSDRLMLQSAFREVGIHCHWRMVNSGVEAIRIAESGVDEPYDVILLDWQLPGASGLEVLASIQRNSNWHSVPVVMLTGMRSAFHVNAAKKAGAYGLLEKPMLIDEWLNIALQIESAVVPEFCPAA